MTYQNAAPIPLSTPVNWFAPYLVLALAVFIAYSNVYDNSFLFDDDLLIVHNESLNSADSFFRIFTLSTTEGAHIAGGFYRPVQIALYWLLAQIDGRSVLGFHILNTLLHTANTLLMYALGKRLRFNATGSFFAALIWGVHPIHTEAVTYISGSADLLFGFFALLGTLIILPKAQPQQILLALPILMLALLSKETSSVLPGFFVISLLAAGAPYTKLSNAFDWKPILRTLPLWIVAIAYATWRVNNTQFDGPRRYEFLYQLKDFAYLKDYAEHFSYRFYTFLATLPGYASLLLWPVGLHMERSFPIYQGLAYWPVVLGLIMLGAAATMIVQSIRSFGTHNVAMSWGLMWFGIAHFPNSGLTLPTNALFLEHWMYVPSMGLLLGIAEKLATMKRPDHQKMLKVSGLVGATAAAIILGFLTLQQNAVWHDPISFYTYMFKYTSNSARAHNNLALAYTDRNDIPAAIGEFRKALSITDTYAETRHNYAISLLNSPDADKNIPEAIANFNRALEIDPYFYRSLEALASIYEHQGNKAKAAEYLQRAAEAKAHFNQNKSAP